MTDALPRFEFMLGPDMGWIVRPGKYAMALTPARAGLAEAPGKAALILTGQESAAGARQLFQENAMFGVRSCASTGADPRAIHQHDAAAFEIR